MPDLSTPACKRCRYSLDAIPSETHPLRCGRHTSRRLSGMEILGAHAPTVAVRPDFYCANFCERRS